MDNATEIGGRKLIPFTEVLFVFTEGKKGFDDFIKEVRGTFIQTKGFENQYGFFYDFDFKYGYEVVKYSHAGSAFGAIVAQLIHDKKLTKDYSHRIIQKVLSRIIGLAFDASTEVYVHRSLTKLNRNKVLQ